MAQANAKNRVYLASPELFLCVKCQETPEKEVFQCGNGHVFCAGCIREVIKCPLANCAVILPSIPIRNLLAEHVLESVDYACPFEKFGCDQSMKRGELATHRKFCQYRRVCASLGFENCQFEFKVCTGEGLGKHLQDAHSGMNLGPKSTATWMFSNIFDPAKTVALNKTLYWKLKDKEIDDVFLINYKLTKDPNGNFESISHAVYYFGDEPQQANNYWITLTAYWRIEKNGIVVKQSRVCEWSVRPLCFKLMQGRAVQRFELFANYLTQLKDGIMETETGSKYNLSFVASITRDCGSDTTTSTLPLKRKRVHWNLND